MGILKRFSDIMSANINDLLDKCEDPSKMIDQTLRQAKEDLAEVKTSTAAVMADEKNAQRNYDAIKVRADKEHEMATRAMKAGNEEDARTFLASEQKIRNEELEPAKSALDAAKTNSINMKAMHNKLVDDINIMEAKRNTIKATINVAKTTETVNKMKKPGKAAESFARYEEKAQKMLDKAQAEKELNDEPIDEMSSLRKKYETDSIDVDDALAALKAECGVE